MKRLFNPTLGHRVHFGRRPEVAPGPHFRLKNYLLASLPDEPASIDYTHAGNSTSAALANIDGNDSLGDCVIAWLYHQLALWTGNATGTAYQPTLEQVIAMYSAIGGYVPGDPSTDQGCDMSSAMNWIVAHGYANGDHPVGWVRVDGTNAKEVRQAVWLFEGCGFGMGLPDAYVNPFPAGNGFTWGVGGASDPQNGHAFLGAGYTANGVVIDTWGLLGTFTYDAIAAYATAQSGGEIDILLSGDMIAKAAQKAPNGFDWASLVADFDSIGGTVPAPSPAPAPTPPAPPTGAPTLAQAQAAAVAALAAQRALMTRAQAENAVKAALVPLWP
jgi:hypothetical protein